jgi:hypothetical protein
MINSKICIGTLLLPLAGALQQMRLATSSTMAPHWQPKPAPAPLVDAPAAPALSVEAAMRIMFDPVGRGKVRHGAYIKLSWRVAIDATSGVLVAPDSTMDSRTGAAARREAAGLDGPDGRVARGLCARDRARGAERPLGACRAAVGDARLLARVPPRRREPVCTSKRHSALLDGVAVSLVELLTGERPGRVALAEGTLAKALFVYGLTQTTLNAPSPEYFAVEAPLAALCLTCFLATNFAPATYERWHAPGLHLCPGIWSAVVAAGHTPLLHMLL